MSPSLPIGCKFRCIPPGHLSSVFVHWIPGTRSLAFDLLTEQSPWNGGKRVELRWTPVGIEIGCSAAVAADRAPCPCNSKDFASLREIGFAAIRAAGVSRKSRSKRGEVIVAQTRNAAKSMATPTCTNPAQPVAPQQPHERRQPGRSGRFRRRLAVSPPPDCGGSALQQTVAADSIVNAGWQRWWKAALPL